ncbi:MAG: ribosome maturation factor RimP [Hyphomonadaceae bacterium]|nr:ribosome maturation factor RimP [Hyphomonadaceae bacterium]
MRASNPLEERIIGLIEPAAADLGYAIVRVRLSGLKRKRLQIMAERIADGLMGIDDCTRLSRALSPVLEAADPVKGEYDLEMSSPGIDRPLVRLEDFARFAGHEAKVELTIGIEGQRKFRGDILGVDGSDIRLTHEHGEARFPFAHVANARLMLTDRLIEEDLRRARAAEAADPASGLSPEPAPPARAPKHKPQRKPQ